ncbi:hypothetical protein ACFL21_04620 [Patescibacteria group bacterium]
MQKKEIFKLALRIASLYLFIQAIAILPALLTILFSDPTSKSFFITIAVIAIYIAAGIGLYLYDEKLISLAVKKDEKIQVSAKTNELTVLAFAIGGLIIISFALASLPIAIGTFYESLGENTLPIMGISRITTVGNLLGVILQLILGVLLFFKAKKITGIFLKFNKNHQQ